jgi:hypothetical protein
MRIIADVGFADMIGALAARTAYAIGLHRTEVNASFGTATHKTRSVEFVHIHFPTTSSPLQQPVRLYRQAYVSLNHNCR